MKRAEPKPISSFAEFEHEISELRKQVRAASPLHYRGHRDAGWKLETTLERFRGERTSVDQYNDYLRRILPAVQSYTGNKWEFKPFRSFDNRENDLSLPNYEFMVYLRHNGFPSPLLDWSLSPYVALFFAYNENDGEKDAAVYVYAEEPTGPAKYQGGGSGGWRFARMIRNTEDALMTTLAFKEITLGTAVV
jgi:FRG domain